MCPRCCSSKLTVSGLVSQFLFFIILHIMFDCSYLYWLFVKHPSLICSSHFSLTCVLLGIILGRDLVMGYHHTIFA